MGLLRFLLAIAVVIAHSSSIFGCTLVGGEIAVQTFYIISGFYIALILNEKYIGINQSYKLFITNRLLRLYPIYWTVLILVLLYSTAVAMRSSDSILPLSNFLHHQKDMSFTSSVFLVFTNIFLFLQDTVMFLGLDTTNGHLFFTSNFHTTDPQLYKFLLIPQAWTIGLEITFYLIAPLLAKRKLPIIGLLIFLSLLLRYCLYRYGLNADPWSYRFFPTELVFFLLGIVSYRIYVNVRKRSIDTRYLKLVFGFMIVFTLLYGFLSFPFGRVTYLLSAFLSLPFIFLLSKNWKVDAYIGDLSYPIYISHLFVLTIIYTFHIPIVSGIGLTLSVCSILFSILLNEVVSKRVEKIRQRRVKAN